MEIYFFNILLGQIKYIPRWALMRDGRLDISNGHTEELPFLPISLI